MTEIARVAYVFPGQGSQFVGMGRDLYDSFDTARSIFKQADDALGISLSRLCFEGPEEELRQTINAQPALATVSLVCLKVAQEVAGSKLPNPHFVAGHSLGEYTALAAAGVLDFPTTISLARERGRLMWEAALTRPGAMAAIIGFDEALLSQVCTETGTWIANINCPGQLVISGPKENIAKAMEMTKARGAARCVALQVSGAFHTPLMQPAADGMAKVIPTLTFRDPAVPVIANTSARPLTSGESIKEELLRQLCNAVQWQRSVEYMVDNGVSTFIEIGPGRVLSGLVKRISRSATTINAGNLQGIRDLAC